MSDGGCQSVIMAADDTADTLRSFVLLAGDVLSPGGCASSSSSVRY